VTQVVEHLPSKYEALSSTPSTALKKKSSKEENKNKQTEWRREEGTGLGPFPFPKALGSLVGQAPLALRGLTICQEAPFTLPCSFRCLLLLLSHLGLHFPPIK
jgi:hypothetical protein